MRKILSLALLAIFIQTAHAAENLYEKHYKSQSEYGLKSLLPAPETKIYVSNHSDEDNVDMLEKGYDMMGSTGFIAGSITPDMALEHAKKIKADVVLVYSKYASKKSGFSKLELIKEAASTSGEVDAALLEEDEEQYNYYASYWAKLPMPTFGVHVIKLKQKDKNGDVTVVDGLKVLAVIKDSPAFKAGLKRGDVLLKMADASLQKPSQLGQVASQHRGQTVDVTYARDDQEIVTQATLNKPQ